MMSKKYTPKKIAIFNQFMDNIGGAEVVTLHLARHLNADIYTTNIDSEKIIKLGFKDVLPRMNSIGKVPAAAPFRHQLSSLRFRFLRLGKKYDFYIISGDWAVSGAVRNKPNLWYVYSPPRELFDLNKFVRETLLTWWKRPLFDIWAGINRLLLKGYTKECEKIISISENTCKRVKNFLGKESEIINPPTETREYYYKKNKGYWLSVNRLLSHKRVDIQLKAFSKMPNEKLIVVGSYEKGAKQFENYVQYLEKIKPSNVEIKHWVSQEELRKLYSECEGFITTAHDEDFGMTPVEAMASGKPVIAGNEGGYKETVISGKTGILIDNINEDKIVEAIKIIGKNPEKYKSACLKRAKEFDTGSFIEKIKKEIYK